MASEGLKKERSVEKTVEMNTDVSSIYRAVTCYEEYPEFVPEIKNVVVEERKGDIVIVRYDAEILKEFSYTLRMKEIKNKRVEWSLNRKCIFHKNEGFWEFKELDDNRTLVTYKITVMIGRFLPRLIAEKIVDTTLPRMMKLFEKRALSTSGRS